VNGYLEETSRIVYGIVPIHRKVGKLDLRFDLRDSWRDIVRKHGSRPAQRDWSSWHGRRRARSHAPLTRDSPRPVRRRPGTRRSWVGRRSLRKCCCCSCPHPDKNASNPREFAPRGSGSGSSRGTRLEDTQQTDQNPHMETYGVLWSPMETCAPAGPEPSQSTSLSLPFSALTNRRRNPSLHVSPVSLTQLSSRIELQIPFPTLIPFLNIFTPNPSRADGTSLQASLTQFPS